MNLVDSPEVRPLILSALALMTAQGMDAFVEDLGLPMYDWIEKIGQLEIPYRVLHGEMDPTSAIAELSQLADQFDQVSLVPFPKCGELIFYHKPRGIVDELILFDRECR